MKTILPFLLAAVVVGLSAPGTSAATLVENGKPVATIVISEEALAAPLYTPLSQVAVASIPKARKIRLAAEELQRTIEKMTGAKLPIVGDNVPVTGNAVLIGESKKTAPLNLNVPRGMTPELKDEGYLIWAGGDTLVLAGNDDGPYNGTFFAVAEFLERQGVRWFMPGEFGEYIPKTATIKIADIEFRDKPSFIMRGWTVGHPSPSIREDEGLWRLRHKQTLKASEFFALPGDGHLSSYIPGINSEYSLDKEFTDAHPEYYARRLDGSIDLHMVNLSHPDVPKLVAEKIKARIKVEREKNPLFNSLGFAPYDGRPMDLGRETMRNLNQGFKDLLGREGVKDELSSTEEWIQFVNKVTEEVVKDYPGFIITTNGYSNRNLPPEGVSIHPNMGIMFAAIFADLLHAFDDPKSYQQQLHGQMLQRWAELNPRVFIYSYNFPGLASVLTAQPETRKLARNMPLIEKWGVIGFSDEQIHSWMAGGIPTFYTRVKLHWNVNTDVKVLLDDFFEKWYGPARVPSQAFWDALEDAMESTIMLGHEDRVMPYVYSDELIAVLDKNQAEAEKLATEEPYQIRVHLDRLILEHLKGYMAMTHAADEEGDFAKAVEWADSMMKQRAEIHQINKAFHATEQYSSGEYFWSLAQRKAHYGKIRDMFNGTTGTLIVKAERNVPFILDPADKGRMGRWYMPGFDRSQWQTVDTSRPFFLQVPGTYTEDGVPYTGYMWYVFEVDVPQSAIGKPISLYAPLVAAEAWTWINGEYVGHRPYNEAYIRKDMEMGFDVTRQVREGKNVIGVRVSTGSNHLEAAEGFLGSLFLYSPKPTSSATAGL